MAMRKTTVLSGALAGLAATLPMTVVMSLWHRRLPWLQREPLPPRKITERMLDMIHVRDDLTESQTGLLTAASHFSYGAGMGGVFGMLPQSSTPATAIATGMAYGLGVWSGSYLGWLPAVGLHRSAMTEPRQRTALMVTAHLVWGGSLGLLSHWFIARPEHDRE